MGTLSNWVEYKWYKVTDRQHTWWWMLFW